MAPKAVVVPAPGASARTFSWSTRRLSRLKTSFFICFFMEPPSRLRFSEETAPRIASVHISIERGMPGMMPAGRLRISRRPRKGVASSKTSKAWNIFQR